MNRKHKLCSMLVLISLAIASVSAQQGCIRLEGSSVCPEFNGMAINASLIGASSTSDFDKNLRSALTSGSDAKVFANLVECPKLGSENAIPRFKTTFLCQGMVAMCGDESRNIVCRDTCVAHTGDMEKTFRSMCPDSRAANDFLNKFRSTCEGPVNGNDRRHGQGNCIAGALNEKSTCGEF
jgi:hypothetical protein